MAERIRAVLMVVTLGLTGGAFALLQPLPLFAFDPPEDQDEAVCHILNECREGGPSDCCSWSNCDSPPPTYCCTTKTGGCDT